jgi:hypothetical protein
MLIMGLVIKDKRIKCEEIYAKYFGEEYELKYDNDYSVIISNHTGWIVNILNIII